MNDYLKSKASSLLLEIARCENVISAKNNEKNPCKKIVDIQSNADYFQVPEAWNGDITTAKILFISSNPSYNPNEEGYPSVHCLDEDIIEFFSNRFSNDYYKKIRWNTYLKKYTSWILDDVKFDEASQYICSTEIVHCKSKSESGVKNACDVCAGKWLDKILGVFQGEYIVLLGAWVKKWYENNKDNAEFKNLTKFNPIIMPHPNARGITDIYRLEIIDQWKNEG